MRIFVTGATGYIGGAVSVALRRAGHDVRGLVREGLAAQNGHNRLTSGWRWEFVGKDLAEAYCQA